MIKTIFLITTVSLLSACSVTDSLYTKDSGSAVVEDRSSVTQESIITLDESPFFSPNGGMIIFATNRGDRGVLSVVSLLGRETFELASKEGEVREPNWSHYSR